MLSVLLRALEQRGYEVRGPKDRNLKLIVLVNGEEIALRLVESVRLKPGTATKSLFRRRTSPKFEYRTSTLTLYLQSVEFYYVSRKRADERSRSLEDRIEEIVLEFTQTADAVKQRRTDLEREQREAQEQAELRRLQDEEARQQKEKYRRRCEVIESAALALEMSQRIRRLVVYLGTAEKTNELSHESLTRFNEMLKWCSEYASSMDPTNEIGGLLDEFFDPHTWSRKVAAEAVKRDRWDLGMR